MRKTAILILLAGFVFVFYSLEFMGVDLLIDAVGWLMVWNGVRALHKRDGVFRLSVIFSLMLVPISALQLFFTGPVVFLLWALRYACELLFYFTMMQGFCRLLCTENRQKNTPLVRAVFLCAMLPFGLPVLFGSAPELLLRAAQFTGYAVHLAFLLVLWRLALLLDDA